MLKPHMEEKLVVIIMKLALCIVMGSLSLIFATVIIKGMRALSLDMVLQLPHGGYYLGKGGGILNAIVGSLVLVVPATFIAYYVSLGVALFMQKDFMPGNIASALRLSLEILWGVPSIVYGIFCLVIMVYVGIGTSLLAGIAALTLLEIPIIARAIDESISNVPVELKEASYSLGSTKFETVFTIARKQAQSGIIAGVILGLGRGIGDAASILFTAGFSDHLPATMLDSTAALPTMIFNLYSSPIVEVRERAYAAAFLLLLLILLLSVLSRTLSSNSLKFRID